MAKNLEPLRKAIQKGNFTSDEATRLHNNYECVWIDNDNSKTIYVYQHINRPAHRLITDVNGNIQDGYLDSFDYEKEAELVEEMYEEIEVIKSQGGNPYELLDDPDWDEDDLYDNPNYVVHFPKKEENLGEEKSCEEQKYEELSNALWIINKQAKAYRDEIRFNKNLTPKEINRLQVMQDNYYALKHYTLKKLHYKCKEGTLKYGGIHKGNNGEKLYYVEFGDNDFHIKTKDKRFAQSLEAKNADVTNKKLPKIIAEDYSRRNDRQPILLMAEESVCEFLNKGTFEGVWKNAQKEIKRISRDDNGMFILK